MLKAGVENSPAKRGQGSNNTNGHSCKGRRSTTQPEPSVTAQRSASFPENSGIQF